MEYNGKCVGYYRELDEGKEVVVGFDIRESDFPLRAEFPVFLANAMIYLTDTSYLASNVYYAGEEIVLQPWVEADMLSFDRCRDSQACIRLEMKIIRKRMWYVFRLLQSQMEEKKLILLAVWKI